MAKYYKPSRGKFSSSITLIRRAEHKVLPHDFGLSAVSFLNNKKGFALYICVEMFISIFILRPESEGSCAETRKCARNFQGFKHLTTILFLLLLLLY